MLNNEEYTATFMMQNLVLETKHMQGKREVTMTEIEQKISEDGTY